ncbi:MAG: AmmeMemoRadiSam system protein A [Planctomycetota bacterium]|nr:MAG: AmmeMemoRadiSam system protein A [Planctomycetota bacterium]
MAELELLTQEEQKSLLQLARKSIEGKFLGQPLPKLENPSPNLEKPMGAFVTLHKQGSLRGCIGRLIGDGPLWLTVALMAREAAFHDPRFPPLEERELQWIDIEISVLSPLKKIQSIEEIEVGKHGLYLIKGPYRGVLLPQVAVEYGWDRETFLAHTARKAGLMPHEWQDSEIYIFSALVFGEKELGLLDN